MLVRSDILTAADGEPVAVENSDGKGAVLLVCEHASSTLPASAGDLGLQVKLIHAEIKL